MAAQEMVCCAAGCGQAAWQQQQQLVARASRAVLMSPPACPAGPPQAQWKPWGLSGKVQPPRCAGKRGAATAGHQRQGSKLARPGSQLRQPSAGLGSPPTHPRGAAARDGLVRRGWGHGRGSRAHDVARRLHAPARWWRLHGAKHMPAGCRPPQGFSTRQHPAAALRHLDDDGGRVVTSAHGLGDILAEHNLQPLGRGQARTPAQLRTKGADGGGRPAGRTGS